jgi:predicted nuclease of predicted toxin-antitoxin system
MQFVADENVSHRVVERLRADGHYVMLVAEMRSGMSDTDVLKLAETENCILVTEDRDFGELIFRQQLSVQGVVLLELDRLSTEADADHVAQAVKAHSHKLLNNLCVIEPTRFRVRPLPR